MHNSWLELPAESPYILEMDREAIERYNRSVHSEQKRVIVESIPEPFIGNSQSARVILLNLNPGHTIKIFLLHFASAVQKITSTSSSSSASTFGRALGEERPVMRRSRGRAAL